MQSHNRMKRFSLLHHTLSKMLLMLCTAGVLTACSEMKEELPACPQGLNVHFKYNYNLDRADMFRDQVGSVTVYLFDEEGHYVDQKTVSNEGDYKPLSDPNFSIHFDVKPGRYQYEAVAFQRHPEESQAAARYHVTAPSQPTDDIHTLAFALDENPIPGVEDTMRVDNGGLPLDTLWIGRSEKLIEVGYNKVPKAIADTCSLMRDTKQITVALRNLDEPNDMDCSNYRVSITTRQAQPQWFAERSNDDGQYNAAFPGVWNDQVSEGGLVRFTPYAAWNTEDKKAAPARRDAESGETTTTVGRMAHYSLMTSRLLWHTQGRDDAQLDIYSRKSGHYSARLNLADMLYRSRAASDMGYVPQIFMDRCHDYHFTIFLKGDNWSYVSVEIGVLSWTYHIQNEDL